MDKIKKMLWLLGTMMYISAFTFGGGYVVIPMVRKSFVQKKKLMTEPELMKIAAMAQSSPGAIAVNTSTLVGYRIDGMPGMIASLVGTLVPPIILLTIIAVNYAAFRDNQIVAAVMQGMEAGVAAIIVDFVIDMCKAVAKEKKLFCIVLIPATFIASFLFSINVALILIACVLAAIVESAIRHRKRKVRNELT
ncbi:chromate transporter [Christensenellaceae bacterium OttesenSCG-928-K19]|nr:chromate transporter [Christensenellaceae bacterium OttesenSCG-928-K19]